MKASVLTLGCKVNQYESDVLAAGLKEKGYEVTLDIENADIYIINTCAVTNEAERKSRQMVSRALKQNPNAKIFVVGCGSELNSISYLKENVNYILGTNYKDKILDLLEDTGNNIYDKETSFRYPANLPLVTRTRAYIKIQDGCDAFCSYCIIPQLRGVSRSRTISSIVFEAEELSKNVKEIILTGINISLYGNDIGVCLIDLIKAISHINIRIRFGSFYVDSINEDLLKALKNHPNFCEHFHLSLQSGDNNVLKDMNRSYNTGDCEDKINLIKKHFPNASITADIITGYPTETEEMFLSTLDFIKRVKLNDIHCFVFSLRKGTKAAMLKDLPIEIKKDRQIRIMEIAKTLRNDFLRENINVEHEVLFEETDGDELKSGFSKNYIRIYSSEGKGILKVTAKEIYKDGLRA